MESDVKRLVRLARLALASGLLLVTHAALAARGDVFVCTDAKGRTITSDQPPAECAGRPIKEMRADGSVRRVIEPPPTAEQRAQKADEDRRKREEETRRREQARRDASLLETFSSEQEIEGARLRALSGRRSLVDRANKRKEELQRERRKLDSEAEFYVNRTQPDKLKRAFESNAAMLKAQDKIIADTEVELARINERFDVERDRFRALVQSGVKPMQRGAPAAKN